MKPGCLHLREKARAFHWVRINLGFVFLINNEFQGDFKRGLHRAVQTFTVLRQGL